MPRYSYKQLTTQLVVIYDRGAVLDVVPSINEAIATISDLLRFAYRINP